MIDAIGTANAMQQKEGVYNKTSLSANNIDQGPYEIPTYMW